jgi:hypothetical protein
MDANFATMVESQHVHTQVLIDIKSMFFEFLGGRSTQLKLLKWNKLLLMSNNTNRFNIV